MTLTTLTAEVYRQTNLNSSDATVNGTMVTAALNEAIRFIESIYDWPWLLTTASVSVTANTNTGTIPTAAQRVKTVKDQYGPLQYVGYEEFYDAYRTNVPGNPDFYTVNATQLLVFPTPTTTTSLDVLYIAYSTALVSGADNPLIPAQYQDAIVTLASSYIFRNIYQYDKAKNSFMQFENWLKVMQDNRRRVAGPRRIRTRSWG
jgi:hypothetical protein